jgi:hypothetical protein
MYTNKIMACLFLILVLIAICCKGGLIDEALDMARLDEQRQGLHDRIFKRTIYSL